MCHTVAMKTVVITGGTSGIGLAFVELFTKDGWDIVVVASSKAMPKNSPKVLYIQQDLSINGASEQTAIQLKKHKKHIHTLVNNAGFGQYGRFEEIPLARQRSMIQVNIVALTELTHLLLPDIIKAKGRILNVASTAAFAPGPFMNVYFATKHYVLAFSEALQEELQDKGVSVTALCPGPTLTHFGDQAGASKTSLFRGNLPTAMDVASFGYSALLSGKTIAIHKLRNRVLILFTKYAPRSIARRVMANSLINVK